jgi:hypothetical protein
MCCFPQLSFSAKHFIDITKDILHVHAAILALCETRVFLPDSKYDIPGFSVFFADKEISKHGMAIYACTDHSWRETFWDIFSKRVLKFCSVACFGGKYTTHRLILFTFVMTNSKKQHLKQLNCGQCMHILPFHAC